MPQIVSTPSLSDRFSQAFVLAHELHARQVRKGSEIPYISHLMAVSGLVLEDNGSENEAIAALLHDAVEDQGGVETLNLIRDRFGDEVATLVDSLSESVVIPKPPWRQRKEGYLDHLQTASASTLRVAIADKLHNASCQWADYQALGDHCWDRFNASKDEILWFMGAFIQACKNRAVESRNLEALERLYQAFRDDE